MTYLRTTHIGLDYATVEIVYDPKNIVEVEVPLALGNAIKKGLRQPTRESKMMRRNFLLTGTIKRVGLRKIVMMHITDGQNELIFKNSGGFEITTDKPLSEPLLRKFA
jgi:hypothetical protein